MRASILVGVAALLLLGELQDEALGEVVQEPTVSDSIVAQPGSGGETGTEGGSSRQDGSFGGRADKTKSSGESPVDQPDEELEERFAPGEGSRSVGGAPAGSPPDWLVGSWYQKASLSSGQYAPVDRFAGFMVRLNDIRLLTYKPTCSEPENRANKLNDRDKKIAHEQLSFSLQEKINTREGPGGTRLFGCSAESGKFIPGGDQMGIFEVSLNKGWESYNDSPDLKTKPPLQKDPSVKDDCYLYSYSGNSDPNGEQDYSRTFTRIKVWHVECRGSICTFTTAWSAIPTHGSEEEGAVCHDYSDAAAPILCGSDRKLSFLTFPLGSGEIGCNTEFKALRIADHYEQLFAYVNKIEQLSPPSTW